MNLTLRSGCALSIFVLAAHYAFAAEPPHSGVAPESTSALAAPHVMESYGKLPLSFEANQGQTDAQVNFLSRGNGYGLFLTPTEAVLALQHDAHVTHAKAAPAPTSPATILTMKLIGGNASAKVAATDELPGKSNYFIGKDRAKWLTNVSNYEKVQYSDVYPGVDLVYYGNQRQLEHDFIVAPGADPKTITLAFEGARHISLNKHGDLLLATREGQVQLKQPVIYQQIAGVKQPIPGHYILKSKKSIGFAIAAYDRHQPLIIDPILVYSTYLGGSGGSGGSGGNGDLGQGIAVDPSGNAYVTGSTASTDFPTAHPIIPQKPITSTVLRDTFVSKLNAAGTALIYSTYLGGSNGETFGRGIAADTSGNAYITGTTQADNFPTVNALYPNLNGGVFQDAFVTKLNATGSALLYSTFLGGTRADFGYAIAVDATGNAYVTGGSKSADFPTVNAIYSTGAGDPSLDSFVTKIKPDGSALVYSTYLTTSQGFTAGYAIAVDPSGNAYVTGETEGGLPTVNAFQSTNKTCNQCTTAFVAKVNPAGSAFIYSTYLGGSGNAAQVSDPHDAEGDRGFGIATDASGNAYITGNTASLDFPTAHALFPSFGTKCSDLIGTACRSAYVTKFNPSGSALVYSTYLGGSGDDSGLGIAVDPFGNAYVTGHTTSTKFPTAKAIQAAYGGPSKDIVGSGDAFVTKFNPTGSALVYSTYLGGSGDDQGNGIAVDKSGNAYVTGYTASTNFPTANAFQPKLKGNPNGLSDPNPNAFITKISDASAVGSADLSILPNVVFNIAPGQNITYFLTMNNFGPSTATSVVVTDVLPAQTTFVSCSSDAGGISAHTGNTVTISFPTVANAHSAFITLVAQVGANIPGGTLITNNATIASAVPDPNPSNNSASVVTVIRYTADLSIQKSIVMSPAPGELKYLISVSAPTSSHGVAVTDSLPPGTTFVSATTSQGTCTVPAIGANGTVSCALGTMPGKTSASVFIVVKVTAPSGTTISNTATVNALTFDPNQANNSSTIATTVP